MPYYIRDPKWDPNLDIHPNRLGTPLVYHSRFSVPEFTVSAYHVTPSPRVVLDPPPRVEQVTGRYCAITMSMKTKKLTRFLICSLQQGGPGLNPLKASHERVMKRATHTHFEKTIHMSLFWLHAGSAAALLPQTMLGMAF